MKKRYAIIRVDNKCPDEFENIKVDYVCRDISCYEGKECSKKFYGDTKEQLVRKIETAVAIMRNKMENKEVYLDRAVATFIVEFLGVE